MSARSASPFSPRVALGLVLFGALSFVLLLWMVGTGIDDPKPGASGGHAMGKGLNGYAALSTYLKKRGYDVSAVQSRAALKRPGLLILTPLHEASAEELQEVVGNRRQAGPTIVVVPKWRTMALPRRTIQVKEGFVQLVDTAMPDWKGFYDDITLNGGALKTGPRPGGWEASGVTGELGRGPSRSWPDTSPTAATILRCGGRPSVTKKLNWRMIRSSSTRSSSCSMPTCSTITE
jgi:hypothetical protein